MISTKMSASYIHSFLVLLLYTSTTTKVKAAPSMLRATAVDHDRELQSGSVVGTVTSFRLVNATSGNRGQSLVEPLVNGSVIDLANFPSNQLLAIDALVSNTTGPIGSVQFTFVGKSNFRTEDDAPFALCGNTGIGSTTSFRACTQLVNGSHTLGATPFSLSGRTGVKGTQISVSFTIINTVPTPPTAPVPVVPTPVAVPTPPVTLAPVPVVPTPVAVPTSPVTLAPLLVVPTPVAVPTPPVTAPVQVVPTPVAVPTPPVTLAPVPVVPTPMAVPTPPVTLPTAPVPVVPTPVVAPVAVPTATGQWIEVNPNAPLNARHEACFVMVGLKAYLLAGRGVNPVNIYDPISRTWTNGTAPPIQIHHTQCVVADSKIWIVSSWTGGFPKERDTGSIYVSLIIMC
jgi:hypothetical protein